MVGEGCGELKAPVQVGLREDKEGVSTQDMCLVELAPDMPNNQDGAEVWRNGGFYRQMCYKIFYISRYGGACL